MEKKVALLITIFTLCLLQVHARHVQQLRRNLPTYATTVSFNESAYNVSKISSSRPIKLVLNDSLPFNFAIQLVDKEATATRGKDYKVGPYYVTFPAGKKEVSLYNLIFDDEIVEDDEYFNLIINSSSLPSGVIVGDQPYTKVTIIDEDSAILFFGHSTYNINESRGLVETTIHLSNPLSTGLAVTVKNNDGNATGNTDYIVVTHDIMFNAERTIVPFYVRIINDNIRENFEEFTLNFGRTELLDRKRVSVSANDKQNHAEVMIKDDNVVTTTTVSFDQSSYSVDENNGIVEVVLVLDNSLSTDITIQVLDYGDTATSSESLYQPDVDIDQDEIDYAIRVYYVLFPAGTTSALFNASINDDDKNEDDETFTLTIDPTFPLTDGVTIGYPYQTTVTIVDNDAIIVSAISFSESAYGVYESSGLVQPVLILSNPWPTDFTVEVDITVVEFLGYEHAIGGGVDYSFESYPIKFIAGETSVPLNIAITYDDICEMYETFSLTIDPYSILINGITVGHPDQTTVTIIDEHATVSFNQSLYSVEEDKGSVQLTLFLSEPLSTDVIVRVKDFGINATDGVDYYIRNHSINIPAGHLEAVIDILIISENVKENHEEFTVVIDQLTLPCMISIGNFGEATVIIKDDDSTTVYFSKPSYAIQKSSSSEDIQIVLSNPLLFDLKITFTDDEGTATRGIDYKFAKNYVIFNAGETSVVLRNPVLDDDIVESDEYFFLTINPPSLSTGVIVGDPGQTTITIVNEDTTVVSFEASTISVNESSGLVQVALNLNNPLSNDVIIEVVDEPGNATGEDYTTGPYSVTFTAGQTEVSFAVYITNDSESEGTEYFTLTILPSALLENRSIHITANAGHRETKVIIIDDDDVPSCPPLTDPSNGVISCSLGDDGIPSYEDTCNFTCNTGYELTGSDTRTCQSDGSWSGSDSMCNRVPCPPLTDPSNGVISCSLGDDGVPSYEDICSFTCNTGYELTGSDTRTCQSDGSWSGSDGMCSRVITLSFENRTYLVDEDAGTILLALQLSYPLPYDTAIQVVNADGSATGGDVDDGSGSAISVLHPDVDYITGPYTATFPAGSTHAVVIVSLIDDDLLEGAEDFTVFIDMSSLPSNVSTGIYAQTLVTIIDNDYRIMRFEQSVYDVNEYTPLLQPVVLIDDLIPFSVTIQVIDISGSATRGATKDYELSGVYTVRANTTSFSFDVSINDDNVFEGNENFTLTITASWPIKLGEPYQITVNIIDDDPIDISFNESMYSVDESSGNVQVVLVLSNPSSTDITVQVTSYNDTATGAGIDFSSGPFDIPFSAGETVVIFNVPITDDNTAESNESFILSIDPSSPPIGVTVANPNQTVVTIIDDDEEEDISCPPLADPSNGTISCSLGNDGIPSYNDICIFTCNTGYQLTGSNSRTCQSDGSWSGSDVMCSRASCPPLAKPSNGVILCFLGNDGVPSDGDSCGISCNFGYEFTGNGTTMICQSDGSWSNSDGMCSRVSCPPLTDPNNGMINCSLGIDGIYSYEDICSFTCNTGYQLTGSNTRTCLGNGIWSGNVTMCVSVSANTVSFQETVYSIDEAADQVQVVLLLGRSLSTDITITVLSSNGLATDADYSAGPYNVVFLTGSTRGTFNATINDDDIVEGEESFTLSIDLSSLPSNIIVGDHGQTTVSISDNDYGVVSFEQLTYYVDESVGSAQLALVISNPASFSYTVLVSTTDGSATAPSDYTTEKNTAISIPANETRVPFDVLINDDDIFESYENFTVSINVSLPTGIMVGEPGQTTVTIVDDDTIDIFFSEPTYSVNESSGHVQLMLAVINASSTDIAVTLVVSKDSTATGKVDFVGSGPFYVTFLAGKANVSFLVSIIDDNVVESDEYFTLAIDPSSLPNGVFVNDPDQATVTIFDDDAITLSFESGMYSVDEDAGTVQPVLQLSNSLPYSFTIQVVNADGSATGGDVGDGSGSAIFVLYPDVDYTNGPYTVTFSAGSTRALVIVPLYDDVFLEGAENFTLSIDQSSLPSGITTGVHHQTLITINDNELPCPAEGQSYSSDCHPFNATCSNPSPPVVCDLPMCSCPIGQVLNEELTKCINVSECTCPVQGQVRKSCAAHPSCTTTCTNRFTPTFCPQVCVIDGCECPTGTVVDEDLNRCVLPSECPEIPCPAEGQSYSSDCRPLNATCSNPSPLVICDSPMCSCPTGQVLNEELTKCINVSECSCPIKGQVRGECALHPSCHQTCSNNETLICLAVCVVHGCQCPNGTVIDEDKNECVAPSECTAAFISFEQQTYNVNEDDGEVKLVLVLRSALSIAITVEVFITNGSATGDVDYDSGPYSVQFNVGVTRASFNVSINNDNLAEFNETFNLSIKQSSLPSNGYIGYPGQTTVNIVDDDVATVSFEQTEYSINEGDRSVSPMLVLSNPLSFRLDVRVLAKDISANGKKDIETSGFGIDVEIEDYDATPFYIRILPNRTRAPLIVLINDDDIYEGDESFTLTIQEMFLPSNVIVGENVNTTVTIVDNEEVNVVVGDNIKVGVGERVIIDCGPLIDTSSVPNLMVKWYFNGFDLLNGTSSNVVISQDKRLCIITRTLLSVGGELGNSGNYTCEVCSDPTTCMTRSTITDICGEPNIAPPTTEPLIFPGFAALTCGQNITISSDGINSLSISCIIFNGSDITTTEVFKNGIATDYPFQSVDVIPFGITDFGNYTFVVSTERCGSTSAVSWVLPDCSIKGQVIEKCASHPDCAKTCKNTTGLVCIQQCVPYGCECPDGTVIDEQKNECVAVSECPVAFISFEQQTYDVNEDDREVKPVLVLSSALSTAITVEVLSTDGSATGGVDYDSGPYSVQFNVGVTRVSFNALINNDNMAEFNETFNLNINQSSLPSSVSIGDHGQTTVNIVDDDGKSCNISNIIGNFKVDGNNLTLEFSGGPDRTIYYCRFDNTVFEICTSPLSVNQDVEFVTVRAYCIVDGELKLQKRRKFENTYN